jgi:DNA-binding NtrC family response regulator
MTAKNDQSAPASLRDRPVMPGLLRFYPLGSPPSVFFHVLDEARNRIGRSPDCTVQLHDELTSRKHAEIDQSKGAWRIQDTDSANGLFVDGRQVKNQFLSGGEVIRVGSTLFEFLPDGTHFDDREHPLDESPVGAGPLLQGLREEIAAAAGADEPVLLTGEPGAGKALAALHLHELSRRRESLLVGIDLTETPEEGAEERIFEGTADGPALVQQAGQGTLFIGGVEALSPAAQSRLLRTFLAPGRGKAAGAPWLIAATHQDLSTLSRQGKFSPELFSLLSSRNVSLPPLREHPEEIPRHVRRFLDRQECGKYTVSLEALELLCCRGWPGNLRDLERALGRAQESAGDDTRLDLEHFEELRRPSSAADTTGEPAAHPEAEEHPWAAQLKEALAHHHGEVNSAATELGLSRSQLYRRAQKCGIKVSDFRK